VGFSYLFRALKLHSGALYAIVSVPGVQPGLESCRFKT
jgi:hypothetical protein